MNLPEPVLSPLPTSDNLWVLQDDFSITFKGKTFNIKRGFKTDGESIPRAFWPITGHPFQGKGMTAALVHDGLYGSELLSREKADLVFKGLLEMYGVGAFSAMIRYRALRMFGWITWKTHTVETMADARNYVSIT